MTCSATCSRGPYPLSIQLFIPTFCLHQMASIDNYKTVNKYLLVHTEQPDVYEETQVYVCIG
jgi:hypothetical protein